jgi:hypothetical protein
MELFDLQTAPGLSLGKKRLPLKFKDVLSQGAGERDLEDLIVAFPSLLNWSYLTSIDNAADLLIISRQPRTQTQKRADLFAISSDGELGDHRNKEGCTRREDATRGYGVPGNTLCCCEPQDAGGRNY